MTAALIIGAALIVGAAWVTAALIVAVVLGRIIRWADHHTDHRTPDTIPTDWADQ